MSNSFYHLTPETVIQALKNSGFDPTGHCMTLNSYENRVYDLKLTDGSHVVAKFYRPGRWSEMQIREEHEFLFDLYQDEIPICTPIRFSDQNTIHETEGIYYSIWPRTGGRASDELSDENLQILGRLLGRIHNSGAGKRSDCRIELTGRTYGILPLQFLEDNNFLPSQLKEKYCAAVYEIVSIYDSLVKDIPFHRIHGDCHLGNLLSGSSGWFFLDFDDFLVGPAVQDVWMLVPARDEEGLRQRDVFLQAYRTFRDFDSSWLKLIEPLRALRYIRYAAWIAQRWKDPAFPRAFPHFGTHEYWEEQTSDLNNQIEFFHDRTKDIPEDIQRATQPEEEQELSNKDYFWDWED